MAHSVNSHEQEWGTKESVHTKNRMGARAKRSGGNSTVANNVHNAWRGLTKFVNLDFKYYSVTGTLTEQVGLNISHSLQFISPPIPPRIMHGPLAPILFRDETNFNLRTLISFFLFTRTIRQITACKRLF